MLISSQSVFISIRAPVRGATTLKSTLQPIVRFQSALPRGERPSGFDPFINAMAFQSTLPCGERLLTDNSSAFQFYFNPRSRAGSDSMRILPPRHTTDFNPRSLAGSDRGNSEDLGGYVDFNPRSLAGSDTSLHGTVDQIIDFNPRSLAGSDR